MINKISCALMLFFYDTNSIKFREKEKSKFSTLFSAKWKDGPSKFEKKELIRQSYEEVTLKSFHNTPNVINEFLNEIKENLEYSKYSDNFPLEPIYGISRNPNIRYDVKNAYDCLRKKLIREPDKKVALIYNSQNTINEFLDEVDEYFKTFSTNNPYENRKIYGITKNPDTNDDYIMVFQYAKGENYKLRCEKCNEKYVDSSYARCEWCIPCQTNFLKKNFANWTSGNKIIDDFIRERQLSVYVATF
ncbi:kinase-like domain-containing protein [Rhizophagus clarus]|uniref:Kinase-like domain-containing protein n=1 Tax=Rhizophagus clarus TaxID=94130 RepID=A0A8H3LNJ9_9GLOM|nr:kinase-like domain-containing protein [Rhizophagus clarus]